MSKRLLCYAKLLRDKLTENKCTFIIQKISEFGIIQEYHKNNQDSKIIEHLVDSINCQYRLELGKDIIKIFLFQEKNI